MKKDLVSISDLSGAEIGELFRTVKDIKDQSRGLLGRSKYNDAVKGRTLVLVFEKPSLRTRASFSVAWAQMGGHTIYLAPEDIGLGKRESVQDVAHNLSRWVEVIAARTFKHSTIEELAHHSSIPVINALSDQEHPCQALGDFMTIKEILGTIKGIKLAFIGDGNNVCNSLMLTAARLGTNMWIAGPKGYAPKKKYVDLAKKAAKNSSASIIITEDPKKAVEDADAVYTDVWYSMGQEKEKTARKKAFKPFQVNSKLLSKAKPNAMILHCLPAHRGEEITDNVLDGPNSVVLHQAENRMHVQKALLYRILRK
ncbi:ornithine carbamoyltransferase [candidate division WOR-3 bacterium]|nr:ornithine carbamoyltransferase [candidate division WOR-3 bacterium]